jgi:phosphomannomutase
VTDSVTSEGLALFLKEKLGLQHCRYLKGYANIINKAKELTATGVNAQVAIETSGHCAMQENGYLDDGTFTAVKVVGLLTREKALHPDSTTSTSPLLDLISDLEEMPVVDEVRLTTFDKSLDTMRETFDVCAMTINDLAISNNHDWEIDIASLEGVRVRLGHNQFFMLRKSLHDPILSFQVEAMSKELFRETALRPLLQAWESRSSIARNLDLTPLKEF